MQIGTQQDCHECQTPTETQELGRSQVVLESQALQAGEPQQADIISVDIFWSSISDDLYHH